MFDHLEKVPIDRCPSCGGEVVYEPVLTAQVRLHLPDLDFLCPELPGVRKRPPEDD